jgi:hypothetical protein
MAPACEVGGGCPYCHREMHYSRDFEARSCGYCGYLEGEPCPYQAIPLPIDVFLWCTALWWKQFRANVIDYLEMSRLVNEYYRIEGLHTEYIRVKNGPIFQPRTS